jgi:hypothetical protein
MGYPAFSKNAITKEWRRLEPDFELLTDCERELLEGPFGVIAVTVSYENGSEIRFTKGDPMADPR